MVENDKASTKRSRHALGGKTLETVLAALGADILGGRHAPGDILPREDELMAVHGVSRTTMREAIKVLSAKGLVETRQKIGARVRPHAFWNLLDPAVLSWHPDISAEHDFIAGLLEVRRMIEPAAAELAAERATAADCSVIEAAYLQMERSPASDIGAHTDADLAFHSAIMAATGNVVLHRIATTIEAALGAAMRLTNTTADIPTDVLAAHRRVMERIRFNDPAGARDAMNHVLDIATEDLAHRAVIPEAETARPEPRRGKR